jgi:acyl dehydratase
VAYRSICGFVPGDVLPPTYPHVLATGVHLAMLGSRAFPVRVAGLIHLANRIELLEPIPNHASLSFYCTLTGPEETGLGQEFSLTTTAQRKGQPVWRETMRFLARSPVPGKRSAAKNKNHPPADAETLACWGAPTGIGRRYAQVSGDYNPIHLFASTAKWFGFERAIAHGMWSLARSTASLSPLAGNRPMTVDARFLKPLLLPGEVELAVAAAAGDEQRFWLSSAGTGPVHISGTLACDEPQALRDSRSARRAAVGVS